MFFEIKNQNIFEIDYNKYNIDIIVNPVNTQGVMGSGLALEFKKRFNEMHSQYYYLCKNNEFNIGDLFLYKNNGKPYILNFPTKENFCNDSKIEYIELGFQKLIKLYNKDKFKNIVFPKIGCGLGNLHYNIDVRPLFIKYFKDINEFNVICLI